MASVTAVLRSIDNFAEEIQIKVKDPIGVKGYNIYMAVMSISETDELTTRWEVQKTGDRNFSLILLEPDPVVREVRKQRFYDHMIELDSIKEIAQVKALFDQAFTSNGRNLRPEFRKDAEQKITLGNCIEEIKEFAAQSLDKNVVERLLKESIYQLVPHELKISITWFKKNKPDEEFKDEFVKDNYIRKCSYCPKIRSTTQKVMKCSRCQNAFYCNTECQTAHWPVHKPNCKPLTSVSKQ